jgi:hypothetical protein
MMVENLLVQLEKELADARRAAEAIRITLNPSTWFRRRITVTRKIYQILERITGLQILKIAPATEILYDVKIWGFDVAVDGRSIQRIPLARVKHLKARILDLVQIANGEGLGIELKSISTLLKSVKGGLSNKEIEAIYRVTSAIQKQIEKELKILAFARENGLRVIYQGKDVLSGLFKEFILDPLRVHSTVVTSYRIIPEKLLIFSKAFSPSLKVANILPVPPPAKPQGEIMEYDKGIKNGKPSVQQRAAAPLKLTNGQSGLQSSSEIPPVVSRPRGIIQPGKKLRLKLKLSPKIKFAGNLVLGIAADIAFDWLENRWVAEYVQRLFAKNELRFQNKLDDPLVKQDILKFRTGKQLENGYQLYLLARLFVTRESSDGGPAVSGRIFTISFMDVTFSRVRGDDFFPEAKGGDGWDEFYQGNPGAIANFYIPLFKQGDEINIATEDAADERLSVFEHKFIKRTDRRMGDYNVKYFFEFEKYCRFFPGSKAAELYGTFVALKLVDITLVEFGSKHPNILMAPPHNMQFDEIIEKVRWGIAGKISFILYYYNLVIQMNDREKFKQLEKYDKYFRLLDDGYTKCQVNCHKLTGDRRIIHRETADDEKPDAIFRRNFDLTKTR